MVGWHHQLNGHEFEQAPGDGEGQGSLVFCSLRSHKESDTTERMNTNNNYFPHFKMEIISIKMQPFLSPEDLPNPGIEPKSLALQADS